MLSRPSVSRLRVLARQVTAAPASAIDSSATLSRQSCASRGVATMAQHVPSWASARPWVADELIGKAENLVDGTWKASAKMETVVDPLTGKAMLEVPLTSSAELEGFVGSLAKVPKSGLHNPYKHPERYVKFGSISARVAEELRKDEVVDYFSKLIQRVSPKSYAQAKGEVDITRIFFENFGGDQVRFLAKSFGVTGDHLGQTSTGMRWPYGPVALITPFNFPLEIPCLQLMGALYMGNKPLLKVDSKVSVVMDHLIRLLIHCGMNASDVDLIHCDGPTMNELLNRVQPRNTLFTGSQKVAEKLALDLRGKVFLEDAGFDWKILGPDFDEMMKAHPRTLEFVSWQCDQDAYACSGQKCSAQSVLFMHSKWAKAGLLDMLKEKASTRKADANLKVGPVLTVPTERMEAHRDRLLQIPGSRVLFGGERLTGDGWNVPSQYGLWAPCAVFVPLKEMMKAEHFGACTTEIFGPFQVITEWTDGEDDVVLEACERMQNHLTAAIVSNDRAFQIKALGSTVNGTQYVGVRARTTGAPQNHWFGPAGDPRGAGIGTPEAIRLVWSCHREIIEDAGPIPDSWTPNQS